MTHLALSKAFNKNTIKVSYRCGPNIASIISSHNRAIMGDLGEERNTTYGIKGTRSPKEKIPQKSATAPNLITQSKEKG